MTRCIRSSMPLAFGAALALANATIPDAAAQSGRGQPVQQQPSDSGESPNQAGNRNQGQDQNARPQSPFNNPEMRLRMLRDRVWARPEMPQQNQGGRGGRGGRGQGGPPGFGSPGGGGMSAMIDMLMSSEVLQDELQLSEEKKEQLKTVNETANQKRREMFQQMFQNRNQGGQGNQGGRGGRGGFDPAMMQQMAAARAQMDQQTDAAIAKVLTKAQLGRLNQIRLRIVGPLAVSEAEVAQKIMLTDQQYAQVLQIIQMMTQKEQEQRQAQMNEMRQMFQNRGGQGGPGQGGNGGNGQAGQAPAANNDDNEQDQTNNRRRGGFDPNSPEAKAMQERMEKAMEEQEKLRKDAESAIGKILASAQKSRFNKMLGSEFDVMKLAEETGGRGFGGFGGPGGNRGGRGGNRGG